jgi:HAD superfamily hydrolase (TIGR01450 family)
VSHPVNAIYRILMSRIRSIRHVAFDLDGTVYLGNKLFPHSLPFLASLRDRHVTYSFLTNNCSRSRSEYVHHLREIGIDVDPDKIQTSAHATAHYIATHLPQVRRLFVLGTPGLEEDFRLAGFDVVTESPDAVVVGFDTALTYDGLSHTAYWISRGLPYIATHPDRVCPTDRPIVLPDCAAICALLETATGRKPDAIPGKPSPAMLQAVFAAYGVQPRETALIGDRLYTDMRMARDAGALAVLTLTGETRRADIETCPEHSRPDLVIENLGELQQMLEK